MKNKFKVTENNNIVYCEFDMRGKIASKFDIISDLNTGNITMNISGIVVMMQPSCVEKDNFKRLIEISSILRNLRSYIIYMDTCIYALWDLCGCTLVHLNFLKFYIGYLQTETDYVIRILGGIHNLDCDVRDTNGTNNAEISIFHKDAKNIACLIGLLIRAIDLSMHTLLHNNGDDGTEITQNLISDKHKED